MRVRARVRVRVRVSLVIAHRAQEHLSPLHAQRDLGGHLLRGRGRGRGRARGRVRV